MERSRNRGPRADVERRWRARSLLVMGVAVKRVAYLIGRSETFVRNVEKSFGLNRRKEGRSGD